MAKNEKVIVEIISQKDGQYRLHEKVLPEDIKVSTGKD